MNEIKQILIILLSAIFSIFFVYRLSGWLGKKFYNAINSVIPDYNPVLGKRISDDPYINSVFNDVKGREEITRLKKIISKFVATVFTVLLAFVLISLYLSDRKEPAVDSSQEVSALVGSKSVDVVDNENKSERNIKKPVQFGPFGDLFNGMLAPILTFATFTGLLVTIIMQNIQMRATITELQMSRIEMSESTEALQAQVKNSTAQKFDNNFYSLLENHMKVIDHIYDQEKNNKNLVEHILGDIKNSQRGSEIALKRHVNQLLNYFLINYNFLKYIKKYEDLEVISYEEAKHYSGILRSLIPDDFILFSMLNCSVDDFQKYKKLLEYYEFFEHISFDDFSIDQIGNSIESYSIKAFGDCGKIKRFFQKNKVSLSPSKNELNDASFLQYIDLKKSNPDCSLEINEIYHSIREKVNKVVAAFEMNINSLAFENEKYRGLILRGESQLYFCEMFEKSDEYTALMNCIENEYSKFQPQRV